MSRAQAFDFDLGMPAPDAGTDEAAGSATNSGGRQSSRRFRWYANEALAERSVEREIVSTFRFRRCQTSVIGCEFEVAPVDQSVSRLWSSHSCSDNGSLSANFSIQLSMSAARSIAS